MGLTRCCCAATRYRNPSYRNAERKPHIISSICENYSGICMPFSGIHPARAAAPAPPGRTPSSSCLASSCLAPGSSPGAIRASTGAATAPHRSPRKRTGRVDGRIESGHDVVGGGGGGAGGAGCGPPPPSARPPPPVMPGLDPLLSGLDFQRGSAPMTENISALVVTPAGAQRRAGAQACPGLRSGRSRARAVPVAPGTASRATLGPDQVRGDIGGDEDGGAGNPRSEPRSRRCADIPPVARACTPSSNSKPDSSGSSPTMTGWEADHDGAVGSAATAPDGRSCERGGHVDRCGVVRRSPALRHRPSRRAAVLSRPGRPGAPAAPPRRRASAPPGRGRAAARRSACDARRRGRNARS